MSLIRFSQRSRFGSALLLVGLLCAGQAKASVFLEDKTWTELRDEVAAGARTVIIPVGGTEQNGPAMALGKHNFRAKALAEQIATKLGNTIVAPVMAYVPEGSITPPQAHMKFPGTLTVSDKVFMDLVASAARSLKHAGFQIIVLIGDHGSYQGDLSTVAASLNKEWKGTAFVFDDRNYYDISQNQYVDALKANGAAASEIGTHAALADTSLMLAVDPTKVRKEIIASKQKLDASVGIYGGNPKKASAALGQLGIDLIVNGTVEAIQKFNATHQVK
ncbi:MAG: creatininase family protein [Alphaproteobacteria bacterium]|nr:creatininase family protein [Alphaproteobacteria bacterium]